VRALDRKLLRDVWRLRGQVLSIALVVAAGVMAVITMRSTLASLERSRDDYYREQRFADVFASVHRAPETLARRIEEVPGVAAVRTRVIWPVMLEVPGLPQTAQAQLVSVPDRRVPMLNDVFLRSGRYPSPGQGGAGDEVLVSERFARANGLAPGDTLAAVINGRRRTLDVVGVALSPEFVYEVDPSAGFLTDERLFGVLWMARRPLAAAADMTGGFNDIVLALAPGASERAVLAELDRLLEPWGGRGAYGRGDQISNRLVSDEMTQLRGSASTVPLVFLGVAAFLLHIVLLRLVATEREVIATLKAFGYRNAQVGAHYLALAMLAVGVGAVLGLVAGFWLGSGYTALYGQFFFFPELSYQATWSLALGAIAVSALAALAGALGAVRGAARLQPAEAMRAEAPARFRPLFLERWGLHRWLGTTQRMVLRNVERRPVRALFSALGVGFALAVLLIGFAMLDSITFMMDRQFRVIQREDVAVGFNREVDPAAVGELARLPGVVLAEGYHTVPVELSRGHRTRRLALTGLSPEGTLRRMTDPSGASHPMPLSGVVLTDRLGEALGVGPGDTVQVELLDRGGAEREVVVAALIDEMLGINGYMTLEELHRLAGRGPRVSGAWLAIERGSEALVFDELRAIPAVSSTVSKSAMLRSFEDQMGESFLITTGVLLVLAGVLAIGVIYNGARIALSERGRELASLRVLGFTRHEVAAMLLGEQAVVTVVGLPLGVVIGYGVVAAIMSSFATDLYRIPLVMDPGTALSAAGAIAVLAAAAGWLVRRRLDRADLISVLKTRE
jgi:putative ABC transport system permease protein